MTTLAVVAHSGKRLDGGLEELRTELAAAGRSDVLWYEASKSRKLPALAKQAIADGADRLFIWGGDGSVQRCIDAVVGSGVTLAIFPAGTANLLARNLGVPTDLKGALQVGLKGQRRALDTGSVNGEHFVVMAGVGLDALMIRDADSGLKETIGRAAYLWTGAKNVHNGRNKVRVKIDGRKFFAGKASCVLVGNIEKVLGGIAFFDGANPDDGVLEVGVITAKGKSQWTRTMTRVALGKASKSPFVKASKGRQISVKLNRSVPYELDGGDRPGAKKLRFAVHPSSISVCVPATHNERQ